VVVVQAHFQPELHFLPGFDLNYRPSYLYGKLESLSKSNCLLQILSHA
jgi:hypothetical protein